MPGGWNCHLCLSLKSQVKSTAKKQTLWSRKHHFQGMESLFLGQRMTTWFTNISAGGTRKPGTLTQTAWAQGPSFRSPSAKDSAPARLLGIRGAGPAVHVFTKQTSDPACVQCLQRWQAQRHLMLLMHVLLQAAVAAPRAGQGGREASSAVTPSSPCAVHKK